MLTTGKSFLQVLYGKDYPSGARRFTTGKSAYYIWSIVLQFFYQEMVSILEHIVLLPVTQFRTFSWYSFFHFYQEMVIMPEYMVFLAVSQLRTFGLYYFSHPEQIVLLQVSQFKKWDQYSFFH